jgi:hypothetical protein
MFINNPVTAANVWTAATRTLTADPATDAGAATLVWTHAARTLTVDPATDAGAATLVWTHATRTLTDDLVGALNSETTGPLNSTASATQNVYGAYVQVVASTAHSVRGILWSVQNNVARNIGFHLSTGGAGSEVVKLAFGINFIATHPQTFRFPIGAGLIPKGVRVAIQTANQDAAVADTQVNNITLMEAND